MNKNTKKIATLVLIAIVAVGSYFIASTYAKYTSEFSGNGSAGVAKWAWTINNKAFTTSASVSEGFSFDPFATIYDTGESSAETDVDSTTKLIGPGTSGSVTLDITNNSEVNAEYMVEFTATNASNVPLQYSLDGTSWTSDITTLNIGTNAANSNGPVAINMGASATQRTLHWKWVYENGTGSTLATNDAADTDLGFAANSSRPTVQISAKVTATQVD